MAEARVRLYSIFKDAAGTAEVSVECPKRLGELIEELRASSDIARAFSLVGDHFMVIDGDGKRLSPDSIVECGMIVHLIPLPSGGSKPAIEVGILSPGDPVDFNRIIRLFSSTSTDTGAVGLFIGVVRGLNKGSKVEKLNYDHVAGAAERVMESIAREEAEKWDLRGVGIYHYTGERSPGEYTLIVVVAGVSRRNIYPALESIVDRVKREVPIFKEEYREEGKVYIVGDREITARHSPERGFNV